MFSVFSYPGVEPVINSKSEGSWTRLQRKEIRELRGKGWFIGSGREGQD